MRSVPGRTACRVTTSRPRCSAVRRRASRRDHGAEPVDVAPHLVALEPVGHLRSRACHCRPRLALPPGRRRPAPLPSACTSNVCGRSRSSVWYADKPPVAVPPSPTSAEQVDGDLGHLLEGPRVVVGQGHREQVAQVVDVEVVVAVEHRLRGARAGGEVEVEDHVEDVALAAAAHERRGETLAQQLAVGRGRAPP